MYIECIGGGEGFWLWPFRNLDIKYSKQSSKHVTVKCTQTLSPVILLFINSCTLNSGFHFK